MTYVPEWTHKICLRQTLSKFMQKLIKIVNTILSIAKHGPEKVWGNS